MDIYDLDHNKMVVHAPTTDVLDMLHARAYKRTVFCLDMDDVEWLKEEHESADGMTKGQIDLILKALEGINDGFAFLNLMVE
ncbi:MAG: hypothetical protein AB1401_00675 [Thermodesulfobacteriota bacterium]